MKIYLASSWRNLIHPHALVDLRGLGHEVYDFRNPAPGNKGFGWRQVDPDLVTFLCPSRLKLALSHPLAIEGFGFDMRAMEWADVCVLLLPCGRSAHLEAGWFAGRGKPVVVIGPVEEPELMYKCFDDRHGSTPIFVDTWAAGDHLASLDARITDARRAYPVIP